MNYLQSTILYAGIILICIHQGESIQCFDCNSHNNSQCALEVVPQSLITNCASLPNGTRYTMCRKIVQIIEFEVNGLPPDNRVIRGCGYDRSNYVGKCYHRSGFGGRQEVCSCLDDLCNGVARRDISPIAFLLLPSVLIFIKSFVV